MRIERKTTEGSPWQTSLVIWIDLGKGLTRREQVILFNAGRTCEVHKLLTGELRFDYALSGTGAERELPPSKA